MNNSQNSNQNPIPPPPPQPNPLPLPNRNMNQEQERINETARLLDQADKIMKSLQTPQAVRELQPFDGNPIKLHSFLRSVENLLPFIEPLKNTPFEKIWLQAIRAKIINEADQVLETNGTPLEWNAIKENLIAYYNDKRDPVTLTRELFQIQQTTSIENFFGQVQNLLSLLINHTNISTNDGNVKQDRICTHQENALQVFLAGLKEPIGGNVRARQPKNLKTAFDAAVEERNFQSRNGLNRPNLPARPPKPITFQFPTNSPRHIPPTYSLHRPMPYSQPQRPNFVPRFVPHHNDNLGSRPPPKALPAPEEMDVDRSIRSKFVNYMNRPQQNQSSNSQRQPFPQRNRFTPAVPPRTARVTELRNMEQNSYPTHDQAHYDASYYDYPTTSSYHYDYHSTDFNDNYYEAQYPEQQDESDQEPSNNQYEPEDTQNHAENLNFQLETPTQYPR